MKALLFHPPTGLFLRQDRCQTPIENRSAMEPPNELGYIAAMMELSGVVCKIQDYPMVDGTRKLYVRDVLDFQPDMIVVATTAATLDADISFCAEAKKINKDIVTIVKVPYLTKEKVAEEMKRFQEIDISLLREYEYTIKEIVEHLRGHSDLDDVKGIVFRKNDRIIYTGERDLIQNLDELPFPARHLIDNKLYIRPDTGEPQATVQTARGCPYQCIYCLAPKLEGQRVRARSPENIVGELKECVTRYGIKNFFLRADTFTFDKQWVISLCKSIVAEGLDIDWVCNSRVDTVDEERMEWMKKAGCWLMSLGVESGNQHILDRMKKSVRLDDSRRAVALCRKYGIRSYCFYVLGLPWDTHKTIEDTINFSKELNGDFFLFHIAVPFPGTELYAQVKEHDLLEHEELYTYSHFEPSLRTLYLSSRELKVLWKRANWAMYTSPRYIMGALSHVRSFKEFMNYLKYGFGKIRNLM